MCLLKSHRRVLIALAAAVWLPSATAASLLPGLPTVSGEAWDSSAVRRVLHTFAYGGQATDHGISRWARMKPEVAIKEILNFREHNLRLSWPGKQDRDDLRNRKGSLRELAVFWASNGARNGIAPEERDLYDIDRWSTTYRTWLLAARMRGLNPFRQKIGLWETNYHMAVNQVGLSTRQVMGYYDRIMAAHARWQPRGRPC